MKAWEKRTSGLTNVILNVAETLIKKQAFNHDPRLNNMKIEHAKHWWQSKRILKLAQKMQLNITIIERVTFHFLRTSFLRARAALKR